MRVLLAASPGGHLNLLDAVLSVLSGTERLWVTLPGPRTRDLVIRGERVVLLPEYARSTSAMARIARASARAVRSFRPDMVITSGAGATVPVALAARARGASVVFIETMARVTTPSSSGRALSRLARRTLVQWPELASSYPRARVCRPLLLEQIEDAGPTARRGTLVVVGTHASPFDRLLAMADRAIATGVLPKPALLQTGAAPFRSTNATVRDYLTPSEMDEAMASAKYIVCHGGVGLISGALRHGSRPIVSARLRRHGEHFDDHQLQLIGKLAPLDLLVEAQDEITPDVVRAADAPLAGRRWPAYPSLGEALADEIAQMRR